MPEVETPQRPVLILGGYGNFGKRIASALTRDNIPVIIAGRNAEKANDFANQLPGKLTRTACFDVYKDLAIELQRLNPAVVINTCGPFQNNNYEVAKICIRAAVPYIDLADGRDFVFGIKALDDKARLAGIPVISGASTVPGLSSAVLDRYKDLFSEIDQMIYGISPGQGAERGLATTQGILSYLGKKLSPTQGSSASRYGWQDIYRQEFPLLGKRWMANCDIPDLDLLQSQYNIKSLQFSAGMELGLIHLGLWGLSWLIRWGLPIRLEKHAASLLKLSNWFNIFGTSDGGMHIILKGKDHNGQSLTKKWFIIGLDGDGPQIPTIPAIILAKKIVRNERIASGAMPCVGLVSLADYLQELAPFHIRTFEDEI
ncbi:saccharopine dehydrogenase [Kiloniella spongiae]|uniref:Saccharopine dehydrogenase n=1 Tax=Kiloniella spongiae TaxID=1489064 RepID=A0A0H2ME46_9PROT|nr:saccharopine dehydrogenase NADP-binding domain-containing protein [Kiloniella spongiae]KLN60461.1 saccharopine dehydrogenase [Kiloniella spongiae]